MMKLICKLFGHKMKVCGLYPCFKLIGDKCASGEGSFVVNFASELPDRSVEKIKCQRCGFRDFGEYVLMTEKMKKDMFRSAFDKEIK